MRLHSFIRRSVDWFFVEVSKGSKKVLDFKPQSLQDGVPDAVHSVAECTRDLFLDAPGVVKESLRVISVCAAYTGESAIHQTFLSRTVGWNGQAIAPRN